MILNFIVNQIISRVTSWQSTMLGGLTATLAVILTNSGIIDPTDVHSLAGQIAQWLSAGLSLVLLFWQDRKQDNTPTQPPKGD